MLVDDLVAEDARRSLAEAIFLKQPCCWDQYVGEPLMATIEKPEDLLEPNVTGPLRSMFQKAHSQTIPVEMGFV